MNLTNEDQELLDRHFEHDLTEPEATQLQQKLVEDESFRQAFRVRELIHERIRARGAAQLQASLKAQLASQRTETETDTKPEALVRPLLGSRPAIVRWAVAASVGVVAAAVLFFTLRDPNGSAPVATQDTAATKRPISQQPPTYAGTDTYTTTYPIPTAQTQRVFAALLIIDETRTEAAYQVANDTLLVYYPQEVYPETLSLQDSADALVLQVNEKRYTLNPEQTEIEGLE